MPRNHDSMGYANHMQEIFHPCPPDEKSESEAILSIACFQLRFRCDVLLHVDVFCMCVLCDAYIDLCSPPFYGVRMLPWILYDCGYVNCLYDSVLCSLWNPCYADCVRDKVSL